MSLFDFNGREGIVSPTSLIIVDPPEDFDPSTLPHALIKQAYADFCARKGQMSYFVRHYDLEDGTRLRIETNTGNDRIFVRPVDAEDDALIMLASPRYVGAFFDGDPEDEYVYSYSVPKGKPIKRKKEKYYKLKPGNPHPHPLERQPGNTVWYDSRDPQQTKSAVSWWSWYPGRYTPSNTVDRLLESGANTSWHDGANPLGLYVDGELIKSWSATDGFTYKFIMGACLHYDGAQWCVRAVIRNYMSTAYELHEFPLSDPDADVVTTMSYSSFDPFATTRIVSFNSSGTSFCLLGKYGSWQGCAVEIDFATQAITPSHRCYAANTFSNTGGDPTIIDLPNGDVSAITTGDSEDLTITGTITQSGSVADSWSSNRAETRYVTVAVDYIGDDLIAYKTVETKTWTSSASWSANLSVSSTTTERRVTTTPGVNPEYLYTVTEGGSSGEMAFTLTAAEEVTYAFKVLYDIGGVETVVFEIPEEVSASREILADAKFTKEFPTAMFTYATRDGAFIHAPDTVPTVSTATRSDGSGTPLYQQTVGSTHTIRKHTIVACDPKAKFVSIGEHSWHADALIAGTIGATITLTDYVDTDVVHEESKLIETSDERGRNVDIPDSTDFSAAGSIMFHYPVGEVYPVALTGSPPYVPYVPRVMGWVNSRVPPEDFTTAWFPLVGTSSTSASQLAENYFPFAHARFQVRLIPARWSALPFSNPNSFSNGEVELAYTHGTGKTFSTNVLKAPSPKTDVIVVSNTYCGQAYENEATPSIGRMDPSKWILGPSGAEMNNGTYLAPTPDFGVCVCYHVYKGVAYDAKPAVWQDYGDGTGAGAPYRAWLSSPIFLPKWKIEK